MLKKDDLDEMTAAANRLTAYSSILATSCMAARDKEPGASWKSTYQQADEMYLGMWSDMKKIRRGMDALKDELEMLGHDV